MHLTLLKLSDYHIYKAHIVLSKYTSQNGKHSYNDIEIVLGKIINGVELRIQNPDRINTIQNQTKEWFGKLKNISRYL